MEQPKRITTLGELRNVTDPNGKDSRSLPALVVEGHDKMMEAIRETGNTAGFTIDIEAIQRNERAWPFQY